jgi:hypothetical protein
VVVDLFSACGSVAVSADISSIGLDGGVVVIVYPVHAPMPSITQIQHNWDGDNPKLSKYQVLGVTKSCLLLLV